MTRRLQQASPKRLFLNISNKNTMLLTVHRIRVPVLRKVIRRNSRYERHKTQNSVLGCHAEGKIKKNLKLL